VTPDYAAAIAVTRRALISILLSSTTLIAGCAAAGGPAPRPSAVRSTGLEPVFPTEAQCPGIASPFGSRIRHDGSLRPTWAFGGLHGGIDISLPEGSPLVALAAGTVVSKGEGGRLEGIYLWLKHSPNETGLPYWLYSKYQHLESPSALPLDAKVAAGQVIARSGKTGTVGGHYGAAGYPHLHLTTRTSAAGDQTVGGRDETRSGDLVDPLVIYRDAAPRSEKPGAVTIPYATPDGQLWPRGTRVVWPVPCPRR
jgi:murein DD-endopeptidase MepM/ murein hydrolase activator NlpD